MPREYIEPASLQRRRIGNLKKVSRKYKTYVSPSLERAILGLRKQVKKRKIAVPRPDRYMESFGIRKFSKEEKELVLENVRKCIEDSKKELTPEKIAESSYRREKKAVFDTLENLVKSKNRFLFAVQILDSELPRYERGYFHTLTYEKSGNIEGHVAALERISRGRKVDTVTDFGTRGENVLATVANYSMKGPFYVNAMGQLGALRVMHKKELSREVQKIKRLAEHEPSLGEAFAELERVYARKKIYSIKKFENACNAVFKAIRMPERSDVHVFEGESEVLERLVSLERTMAKRARREHDIPASPVESEKAENGIRRHLSRVQDLPYEESKRRARDEAKERVYDLKNQLEKLMESPVARWHLLDIIREASRLDTKEAKLVMLPFRKENMNRNQFYAWRTDLMERLSRRGVHWNYAGNDVMLGDSAYLPRRTPIEILEARALAYAEFDDIRQWWGASLDHDYLHYLQTLHDERAREPVLKLMESQPHVWSGIALGRSKKSYFEGWWGTIEGLGWYFGKETYGLLDPEGYAKHLEKKRRRREEAKEKAKKVEPVQLRSLVYDVFEQAEREEFADPGGPLTPSFQQETPIEKISKTLKTNIKVLIRNRLKKHRKGEPPMRVVDFGCFDGQGLKDLYEKFREDVDAGRLELHGVSLSTHKSWKDYPWIKWHAIPLELMGFPKNYFDIGYSHFALNHIEGKDYPIKRLRYEDGVSFKKSDLVYANIARCMKKDGDLALMGFGLTSLTKKQLKERFGLKTTRWIHGYVFRGKKKWNVGKNIILDTKVE